jgi:Fe-S cluster assembly protein SufB
VIKLHNSCHRLCLCDFKDEDVSVFKTPKGINEEIVREISAIKNEPEWMLEYRLKSLMQY